MTPAAQRIAIAEACGWSVIIFRGVFDPKEKDYVGHHESCCPEGKTGKWQGLLPDYLNDLNAMHEAESLADSDQCRECSRNEFREEFTYQLGEIVAPISGEEWMKVHATAAQRAEAFLRTLQLWKDQ